MCVCAPLDNRGNRSFRLDRRRSRLGLGLSSSSLPPPPPPPNVRLWEARTVRLTHTHYTHTSCSLRQIPPPTVESVAIRAAALKSPNRRSTLVSRLSPSFSSCRAFRVSDFVFRSEFASIRFFALFFFKCTSSVVRLPVACETFFLYFYFISCLFGFQLIAPVADSILFFHAPSNTFDVHFRSKRHRHLHFLASKIIFFKTNRLQSRFLQKVKLASCHIQPNSNQSA